MDISDIRNRIGGWEPIPDQDGFREMGEKTRECVAMSLRFIETMNERLMWDMSKLESETDELYLANLGRLTESKMNGRTIIAYLLTIRYLERIADHASYISESISYAVTGKRVSLR
jgi:phosphate transport system protein